jgi:hypothetical protein
MWVRAWILKHNCKWLRLSRRGMVFLESCYLQQSPSAVFPCLGREVTMHPLIDRLGFVRRRAAGVGG